MRRCAAWRATAAPATARDGTRRTRTRRTDSAGCRLRARRRTLRAARRTNPPVEPSVDAASGGGAHGRRGGKPAATAASVSKAASTLPGGRISASTRVEALDRRTASGSILASLRRSSGSVRPVRLAKRRNRNRLPGSARSDSPSSAAGSGSTFAAADGRAQGQPQEFEAAGFDEGRQHPHGPQGGARGGHGDGCGGGVTVQGADKGDTTTLVGTLVTAAEQVGAVLPEGSGVEVVVADKAPPRMTFRNDAAARAVAPTSRHPPDGLYFVRRTGALRAASSR